MKGRRDRLRALCGGLLLALAGGLEAERLAVRSYSASDGLPGGTIERIFRDSKGFLWFCSGEGAVRFDGYVFTPFGEAEGLSSLGVLDVAETRDGAIWLATTAGLRRLDAAFGGEGGGRPPVFAPPGGRGAIRLFEDASGRLWCGTTNGLFRVDRAGGDAVFTEVSLGLPHELWHDPHVAAVADDGAGGLWIGAGSGLYRLRSDGTVARTTVDRGLPSNFVRDLAVARDGTLWVATMKGVAHVRPDAAGDAVVATYAVAQGLPTGDILALHTSRDGRLWIGTPAGLCVLEGEHVTAWGAESGIDGAVFALEETPGGDFWLGSEWGVERLVPRGLHNFGVADGLAHPAVQAVFEDQAGEVFTLHEGRYLSVLGSNRFDPIAVRLPRGATAGWAYGQAILQDHAGEWWLPTLDGLCRFAKSASARALGSAHPVRVYTASDGLATKDAFVVFEDSRGDVWISTGSPVTNGLARWDRATGRIERFRDGPGLPPLRTSLPTVFAEDRGGDVWVAFNGAGLAR